MWRAIGAWSTGRVSARVCGQQSCCAAQDPRAIDLLIHSFNRKPGQGPASIMFWIRGRHSRLRVRHADPATWNGSFSGSAPRQPVEKILAVHRRPSGPRLLLTVHVGRPDRLRRAPFARGSRRIRRPCIGAPVLPRIQRLVIVDHHAAHGRYKHLRPDTSACELGHHSLIDSRRLCGMDPLRDECVPAQPINVSYQVLLVVHGLFGVLCVSDTESARCGEPDRSPSIGARCCKAAASIWRRLHSFLPCRLARRTASPGRGTALAALSASRARARL